MPSAKAPPWWYPWSVASLARVDAIHNARDSLDDGDIIWTVYNPENSVCSFFFPGNFQIFEFSRQNWLYQVSQQDLDEYFAKNLQLIEYAKNSWKIVYIQNSFQFDGLFHK